MSSKLEWDVRANEFEIKTSNSEKQGEITVIEIAEYFEYWIIKVYSGIIFTSLCNVIVRVSVVLKRTVGDSDWRFDNLSGRHLQSHCDIVPSVDGIYVSGYWPDWSIKLSCYWL